MTTTSAISWGQVELVDQETYDKGKALLGRLCKAALETAKKIWNFIKRHKKEIFIYSLLGASLLVVGVSFPKMAMVVLPGLAYMLAFQNGQELPSDVLIQYKGDTKTGAWLPKNASEASVSTVMRERFETCELVKEHLRKPSPEGWTLIEGEAGAGKTSCIQEIARTLAAEGHPVYFLNTQMLLNGTVKGLLDTRFTTLATYLNGLAVLSDKTPILIIDEFQKMIDPTSPGINDSLKMGNFFPLKFNILVATTIRDRMTIESRDLAILRRFEGRKFLLQNLDIPGITETLDRVKGEIFDPSVDRALIDYTVQKLGGIDVNLRITMAVNLLRGKEPLDQAKVEERISKLDTRTRNRIYPPSTGSSSAAAAAAH